MNHPILRKWRAVLAVWTAACSFSVLWAATPASAATGSWSQQSLLLSPYARDSGAMTFDPTTNTTVLFGGRTAAFSPTFSVLGDTWEWNGTSWSVDHPQHAPSPRTGAIMAYDPVNHGVLLYGGMDVNGNALSDTWEWNGTDWTELFPAHEPTYVNVDCMGTDPQNNSVLLVMSQMNQTWDWNGTDWVHEQPPVSPSGCSGIAYDGATNQMLLQNRTETWLWDGSYWLELNPQVVADGVISSGPSGEGVLALSNTFTQSVSETWQWSGSNWVAIAGQPAPTALYDYQMSDGPAGIILFGGYPWDTNGPDTNQTWIFSAPNSSPPANTPEVPYALALPVIAFGLIGGAVWFRRRRSVPRAVG